MFLTGEPGSGKTHTVNRYVEWLRRHDIEPDITASTGIAATHIGGATIHSWSGIGIRRKLSRRDIDAISQKRHVAKRMADAKVLIIDEISMLSAETLTMVDTVLRAVRADTRPFGGVQVVLVGDFFQLPPVEASRSKDEHSQLFADEETAGLFAFSSPAWKQLDPLICYLNEQHRQEDEQYLEFLTALRQGGVVETHMELLRKRYRPKPEKEMTQLFSHNADVDAMNDAELKKLSGDEEIFTMRGSGRRHHVEGLMRGCLSPEILRLKIGARVMFTKNDVMRQRYVNGTLGEVTGFDEETGYPRVLTHSGETITAEPVDWNREDAGRVLATITQIPLRLAWAITVHKSQGMSLDAAHMDLAKTFEYGQGYVALSRVRSLEGLSLAGLNEKALAVHPAIREADAAFQERSAAVRETFGKLSPEEKETLQKRFIEASGGSVEPIEPEERKPKRKKKREPSHHVTHELLKAGRSLKEMARERELTMQTILTHIEKLAEEERIAPDEDCAYLIAGKEDDVERAHDAFQKLGSRPLKPVHEELKGRVPYATLRLARLFYSE